MTSILYLRQTYYTIVMVFMRDEYVSPNFEKGEKGRKCNFVMAKPLMVNPLLVTYILKGIITRKIMELRTDFYYKL